jgi:hypothetical protein
LLAKLVPTFVDRGCHVVSATDLFACGLQGTEFDSFLFRQFLTEEEFPVIMVLLAVCFNQETV